MKNKKKIKRLFLYQLYECAALEDYLEKMALEGWLVVAVNGAWFTFNKMEPRKLHFTVDVFYKSPSLKIKPYQSQKDYLELCWEAGWGLACADTRIQIFCTDRETAIPIHTDDSLILKAINKSVLWQNLYMWFFVPIYFFYIIFGCLGKDFELIVTDYTSLCLVSTYFILTLLSLYSMFDYGIWLIRSILRIKRKEKLIYHSIKVAKRNQAMRYIFIGSLLVTISLLLLYPFMHKLSKATMFYGVGLMLIVATILFVKLIYYKNARVASKSLSIVIVAVSVFVISIIIGLAGIFAIVGEQGGDSVKEKAPLSLEDLGMKAKGSWDATCEETFLARYYQYDYWDSNSVDYELGIHYSVFTSSYDWVINEYVKSNCFGTQYGRTFTKGDETVWEADAVYVEEEGEHIFVVYGDKVVEFRANIVYTKERITIIREKLKL